MNDERCDLAIVGSGGAAFAAAIAARERDLAVVMVESETIGGTCVNTGCVPSKALLTAAGARQVAAGARFPGVPTRAGRVDLAGLVGAKQDLVEAMRTEKYVDLAAEYGWRVVPGTAWFAGHPNTPVLHVDGPGGGTVRIDAAQYLVATGATPSAPPIDGLAAAGYLTSATAMELTAVPASMIVLGGNAVGLEIAQLFARLGADVTVVEAQDRLAPFGEPEISHALAGALVDEGISVLTGAAVTSVRCTAAGYRLIADTEDRHGAELAAEHLLVATGRRPVTAYLGLDGVGVKTDARGAVVVDEHQRTTNPRIWAAGDVTGGPQFVYVAAAQGAAAVGNAFADAKRTVHYASMPRVTFTSPAIATVGPTAADAAAHGLDVDSRVLTLDRVPRAIVDRDTHGLVKIVAERATGRVVGVSMLAHGAGDAILAAVYAVKAGMTVQELTDTWAPYLTAAEALKLAAQTFTRDVTKLSCCAS